MWKKFAVPAMLGGALLVGACSGDGGLAGFSDSPAAATTAALPEKPRVDPACQALAAKIAELKQDGAVDRVEKASQGKGDTVSVKRASLAKVGELNKVNAEFQARCSTYRATTAAVAAPTAASVAAPTVTTPTPPSGATKTAAAARKKAEPKSE